jgi:purine nucleosidase
MTRSFLIDTDTASDDAVALVLALQYPGVQIEAITVVAGNVPLDQGVQNALYTVELCGASIPVYGGMPGPLIRTLETAQGVHGDDGMGDIGLPVSGRAPAAGHGVQVLIDTVHRFAGEITLVTLGPLTNVAVALRQDPSIAGAVSECVIMGGTGQGHGNVTPVTEYNFWADPDAARIVFESGLPVTMVGWDISRTYAVLGPADSAALRAVDTPLAHFCVDIQRSVQQFALGTTKLDPIAMAVALDPTVATHTERCFVAIETGGDLCRGQSVVDRLGILGREPNAEVVLEASRERFVQMLFDAVGMTKRE